MRHLRDLPIKRKLILLMFLTSFVTVMVAGIGTIAYEFHRFHDTMIRDITTQAELVGANSAAALAFIDQAAARETLAVLRGRPRIRYACLFTPDGKIFAEHNPNSVAGLSLPRTADMYQFEGNDIVVFHPIKLRDDVVGYIGLRADLSEQRIRLLIYVALALTIMLLSLVASLLLSTRLQTFVSAPLLELAQVARAIATSKNYSVRATKKSADEIGRLTDDFNEMLAQIEKSDEAVRANEERFRQLAENISEVFWMTNPAKTEMIYISPAYEKIWGRTRESIYAAPRGWVDALHPEDRDRVLHAALTQQVRGTYDEEYRILHADGSIRWIRDRAFPIRDETGTVYRIAGIAEDITERKRLEQEILQISDREQQRIGHDLHDGLCQHLTGTSLAAKVIEQDLLTRGLPQATQVAEVVELIKQAINQARALSHGLSPVELDAHGLSAALQELAGNIEKQTGIACPFLCPRPVLVEDNVVATHLYRIAQEAAANAIKHAKPKRITIALEATKDGGRLTVTDDGLGMGEHPSPNGGMGLHIMSYRARMIGGTLAITPAEHGGTIVACAFKKIPPTKKTERKS